MPSGDEMRVLHAEDDPEIRLLVFRALSVHTVQGCASDELDDWIDYMKPDLLVLGFAASDAKIRALRNRGVTTPIIILCRHPGDRTHCIRQMVSALMVGADDWQPLPIDPRELLARAEAVVRRGRGESSSEVTVGEITMCRQSGDVRTLELGLVRLTDTEMRMLDLLVSAAGRVVSREAAYAAIWPREDRETKIVDVYICKLRRRLGRAGRQIKTVWGQGMRLEATGPQPTPETEAPPAHA